MDQCVYETARFGGGSVMIWVGICHDGRIQLKIVQGRRHERAEDSLAVLWRCLRIGHTTGRLARSPDSRSLTRNSDVC
jgi:hypothetical protein